MKKLSCRSAYHFSAVVGTVLLGAVMFGVPASAGTSSLAGAVAPFNASDRADLRRELGPTARISYHSETGKVRFIGFAPGSPFGRPSGLGPSASPTAVARAFLDDFGRSFGIADPARELQVTSTREASAGRSVVRLQQVYDGVPVLGGELVVNLDAGKNLLSIGGEALPALNISVAPQIERSAARETALGAVAKERSVPVSALRASEPSLWIYDSRILGGPGLGRPTLVWRMDVTGDARLESIDELVLVDAQLGMVALHFDQLEKALYRQVCDANNDDSKVPCTAPYARVEGGAASGITDVNNAYLYAGDTYNFFFNRFGRDSIDGSGMTLISTTRYCDPYEVCPYENAYWDGEQMVYGQGFASADDVVGHELTHGITDYTSHLFYYYQSGAINESLSDVFGEFIDLTNGAGTDTPTTRWQIGEDLPGGAIRDMESPPAYNQPDKMTSTYYTADATGTDNGGVHTNSGVNNKAAFLITDGGIFNGYTVTGIGIDKAALIYYEAETNLLTSASDYADLFAGLVQACENVTGTAGVTSADCTQVYSAIQAVEMEEIPTNAPTSPVPQVCSGGEYDHYLVYDNLENTASGSWTTQLGSGDYNTWYYPQNPNDIGFDATYATSGTTNFWGYDQEYTADYSIAMTSSVAIPAGSTPYLRFSHAYGFENGTTSNYDGGVLEYSTNGGASWADAGSLPTDNGYNGTISSSYDNPLGGRSAFVRESNGYIISRVNLSSLAGQSVRFRFRIGTDISGWDYGWFVDDISLYKCNTVPNGSIIATQTGGPYSVSEGQPLHLNGSGTDPDGDPVSLNWNLTDPSSPDYTDASGPSPTIDWNTLVALGFNDGPVTHTLRMDACDLGPYPSCTSAGEFVNVLNAPPGIGISGPSEGSSDQGGSWTFSATDPSPIDQAGAFTYKIDWNGDGTTDQTVTDDSSVSISRAFSAVGPVIKATATDKDGGESAQTVRAVQVHVVTPPTTGTTPATSKGKIASCKLSKKSFPSSQAGKVKLICKFSPKSKLFRSVLSLKKGKKWTAVKSVIRVGSFKTSTLTVKKLFAGKPVKRGAYRLKLSADANSKTLSFRVT